MSTPVRFCAVDKPRCWMGHVLRGVDPVVTDRIVRCDFRATRGDTPCGQRLYLARVTFLGEPTLLVTPLSDAQVRALAELELTMLERLAYLHLTVPGVEMDLRRRA